MFFGPPGPPTEKNFGPAGSPKVVQIVPLESLTLLKRSGILKNMQIEYKYYVELFCLAKVMPKTGFLATVEGFLAGQPTTFRSQNPQKSKIQSFLF